MPDGQGSLRAFVQRFVIALVIASVLMYAVVARALQIAEQKVAHVATAPIDPSVLQPGGNYLLIGSDTRSFVDTPQDAKAFGTQQQASGQRSDTIMVAHVDRGGTGFLVSFPRDLWVAIPGIGHAKINAAFNRGPQRVIETIEQDFDVPITHYIQVDFAGFRTMVDAIGRIPIYFPAPARDLKSGLDQPQPGCRALDGGQALAYVRSRYYQSFQNGAWRYDPTSDLGRIKRQQYFLRTLAQQTLKKVERSPWHATALADKMLASLQRDPRLDYGALRPLAHAFRAPGDIETVTLPTHRQFIDGQDALVLDDAKAAPLLARLRGQTSGHHVQAPPNVAPAAVHLTVENGTRRSRLASTVADALRAQGFGVAGASNADRNNYAETEVRYSGAAKDHAQLVASRLGVGKLVRSSSALPGGVDVLVILGDDFSSVPTPPAATHGSGSRTTARQATATTDAGSLPAAGC